MAKVTVETILSYFAEWIANKVPISPATWVDSAQKLNILVEDVDNEIDHMEALMAEKELELIKSGESAAKARVLKKEAISYERYLNQVSLRKRIEEHIRLAKKRSMIQDV